MNKSQLKKELTSFAKDSALITPSRLQIFLGMGYNGTMDILSGLEYVQTGKGRKYFISDVTERLMERMQI